MTVFAGRQPGQTGQPGQAAQKVAEAGQG